MYHHIGLLGIFILFLLCYKKFLHAFLIVVLFAILLINIKQALIIAAVAISATVILSYRNKGPKIINLASTSRRCNDDIFLGLKFGMGRDEVNEIISLLEKDGKIRKCKNCIFYISPDGDIQEVYLYYKASGLWSIKIIYENTPIREIRKNIHQEMIGNGYVYYKSLFFNKLCYIKQNIVVSMYYTSNRMNKLRGYDYKTWLDYTDSTKFAKKRKKQLPFIWNHSDL